MTMISIHRKCHMYEKAEKLVCKYNMATQIVYCFIEYLLSMPYTHNTVVGTHTILHITPARRLSQGYFETASSNLQGDL